MSGAASNQTTSSDHMMATVSRSASEGVMGIAIGPHPLRVFEAGAASAAATMARDNAEQIGGLKVKLGNLEKENHELEEANNKLRQENAAWKKKVAELTSHIDELSSGLQVAVKERELSETTFTEQISALTNQAAFSEKKRIELEKENIRLKQNNADLLKKVAKLEFTVAQLEGDLEIEVDARREAETRLREQLSEAKNTAKEALSRVSDLEAGVEGLRVSEEELTRRDCAISLRTFGVETSKAVMHYIWPDYDEDIGSLKDMVDVLHTLKADGPLSGSQNWIKAVWDALSEAEQHATIARLDEVLEHNSKIVATVSQVKKLGNNVAHPSGQRKSVPVLIHFCQQIGDTKAKKAVTECVAIVRALGLKVNVE